MPVNLHILTGFNYSRFERTGLDTYRTAVKPSLPMPPIVCSI